MLNVLYFHPSAVSLTDLSTSQFIYTLDEVLIWSGFMTFSDSWFVPFSTQQLEQRWTGMQKEIWESAKHLQIFISGRFDKTLILSKKGDRQEKPLKPLILKENGDAFLMTDKCCLHMTWTACRWAICASKLSRLHDWKEQNSKSNNYLYFLESAHSAASCTDLPHSRA